MSKGSDKFFHQQRNIIVSAARKLHAWAMQYGDSDQRDLSLAMLEYVIDTTDRIEGYEPATKEQPDAKPELP